MEDPARTVRQWTVPPALAGYDAYTSHPGRAEELHNSSTTPFNSAVFAMQCETTAQWRLLERLHQAGLLRPCEGAYTPGADPLPAGTRVRYANGTATVAARHPVDEALRLPLPDVPVGWGTCFPDGFAYDLLTLCGVPVSGVSRRDVQVLEQQETPR